VTETRADHRGHCYVTTQPRPAISVRAARSGRQRVFNKNNRRYVKRARRTATSDDRPRTLRVKRRARDRFQWAVRGFVANPGRDTRRVSGRDDENAYGDIDYVTHVKPFFHDLARPRSADEHVLVRETACCRLITRCRGVTCDRRATTARDTNGETMENGRERAESLWPRGRQPPDVRRSREVRTRSG